MRKSIEELREIVAKAIADKEEAYQAMHQYDKDSAPYRFIAQSLEKNDQFIESIEREIAERQ